MKTKQVKQFSD